MPATLYDTQQIEVLRGPQGTIYGANALAGLVSARTTEPGTDFELNSEITGCRRRRRGPRASPSGMVSPTVPPAGGWLRRYLSDGFRHNAYLDENSTNGYDEGTVRGKLHWQLTDALQADLTLMHVNIDNGYDAWSIYNTYTTYSNELVLRMRNFPMARHCVWSPCWMGWESCAASPARPIPISCIRSTVIGATTRSGWPPPVMRPMIIFKATTASAARSPRTCG